VGSPSTRITIRFDEALLDQKKPKPRAEPSATTPSSTKHSEFFTALLPASAHYYIKINRGLIDTVRLS